MSEVTYTIKEEVFKEATRIAEECHHELHNKLYVENKIPEEGLRACASTGAYEDLSVSELTIGRRIFREGHFNVKDLRWYNEELESKYQDLTESLKWVDETLASLDTNFLIDADSQGMGASYTDSVFNMKRVRINSVLDNLRSDKIIVYINHMRTNDSPYNLNERFKRFLEKTSKNFSGTVEVSHRIQQEVDWIMKDAEKLVADVRYKDVNGISYIDKLAENEALRSFDAHSDIYFNMTDNFNKDYQRCLDIVDDWKKHNKTVEENKDSVEVIQSQPEPHPTSITVGMGVVTGLGVLFLMTVLAKLLG